MRRDKGLGSLYRRKDGLWVAQYKGQYRYSKDKATAKHKLTQMLRQPDVARPTNITVGIALDQYLEASKPNLKPRTINRYSEASCVHLKPALGSTKLHKLTALEIESLYARMLDTGSSPATVRLVHAVLSSAIKRVVRLSLLKTNVCTSVQLPKLNTPKVQVFSPDEVAAILTAAKHDRLHALYLLGLSVGAREGELLGLQIQDYDPSTGALSISRTLYNGAVGSPKSKQGNRTIKLPKQAQQVLETHIEKNGSHPWIFTNTHRGHIHCSTFSRTYWKPLLVKAGVPYRNFHTCRHTVASNLLSKQLPIPAVAAYLGHTPQTLLKTYAHVLKNDFDLIAAALDE